MKFCRYKKKIICCCALLIYIECDIRSGTVCTARSYYIPLT